MSVDVPRTDVRLLDDEDSITPEFEECLARIFSKYAQAQSSTAPAPTSNAENTPSPAVARALSSYMTPAALDRWAIDTNGEPFSEESKQEMVDFLDMDDDGNLTFKGFLQIYQLQTENDEDETWRDLEKHGFDRALELVSARDGSGQSVTV
ncbi:hypothetical protein BOTBODRAFT_29342 [Botryobasidium botryosum FD-172 SS1]|uniref:EF-hand domain-containing protein n=1 Tax=Botryobasidium botryosum (strain FD-172 SS1) TaxID=930990 RepID=A0A067MTJ2_BOTB1|nr:hypothetical protein BOTBODRAFT_29342 [Botryobasidium botryosum FD-172 SS1]